MGKFVDLLGQRIHFLARGQAEAMQRAAQALAQPRFDGGAVEPLAFELELAEVELLGSDLIIEDHDDHADVETGASITDMLVDDPEVEAEVEVVEPEEDTLSLNELAEQEEGESENAEPEA